MAEKITELARRLRPFLGKLTTRVITQVLNAAEGPGIDIPPDTNTIGLGGDTILLYDSGGLPVAEYPFTEQGLRDALDDATSGDVVWLPAGQIDIASGEPSQFVLGDVIDTGAIPILNGDGTAVTGLVIDNYYAIEATDGPWYFMVYPNTWSYLYRLNNGEGWSGVSGNTYYGMHFNPPNWVEYTELIGGNIYRMYWKATTTSILIGILDSIYTDNNGTWNWKLSSASKIGVDPLVIPAGVELVGLGKNSIINGVIQNNGILTNLKVIGTILGDGTIRLVANPDDELFSQVIHSTVNPGTSPLQVASSTLINNLNADLLDGLHAGEIGAVGLDWINVKNYGAVGNGITDDTDAIGDAVADIPAGGAILYFPPGDYVTSGGFTLANPTTVLGCGMGNIDGTSAVSQVQCTSSTAALFTVTAKKAIFRDIALKNTSGSTPSDGAGIVTSGSYLEQKVDFESVSVYGFWINIDVQVGGQWTANNLFITCPVKYGLKIRNTVNQDAGDWSIANSNFNAGLYNSDAAIRIESSGGGKITNCKINCAPPGDNNQFNHGIDLTGTTTTSIILISNCSIENIRGDGIHISWTGGSWDYLIFNSIQFGLYGNSTGSAININGAIEYVIITNCIFSAGTGPAAITLTNLDYVYIAGYLNKSFGQLVSQSGCTNVVIDGPVTVADTSTVDLTLSDQQISAAVIPSGIKLDDLGTPDDNTDLNATTDRHGLLLKLDGGTTKYLRADGTWVVPSVSATGKYRQFVYVVSGGDFSFVIDGDGNPIMAQQELE